MVGWIKRDPFQAAAVVFFCCHNFFFLSRFHQAPITSLGNFPRGKCNVRNCSQDIWYFFFLSTLVAPFVCLSLLSPALAVRPFSERHCLMPRAPLPFFVNIRAVL